MTQYFSFAADAWDWSSGGVTDESLWQQPKVWRSLDFLLCCFMALVLGRDTVSGHLSEFPSADIDSHSNELRSKLGQLAVSITWLTCGCRTCFSLDHLFNPSALFLHTSPGCWKGSWQFSQKECELVLSISWWILLLQLSPAHLYLQHHVSPPPSVSGASLTFHASLTAAYEYC